MYNKKQIKQKSLALAVTSVMSASFMINNDSAQAMKALKAIGNSIKKASEDKKQQKLEKELAILMHNKLHFNNLTKEQETKLVSNIEIVKISNGNVKSIYYNDEIEIVNPVSILITHYNKKDKFVSLLEWINLHIPEAFNVDNITTALFRAIKEGDTSYTKDAKLKKQRKQKATAMCKHLLVYNNPDLSKKCKCEIKQKPYTFTALEYAQAVGLPEVVEMILDKSGGKQYLLYNAICSGNPEEVKKAISEGANVSELVYGTDLKNYNPVDLALTKGNTEVAKFLIESGSKVSDLDVALVNRSAEMFDYLIQKGFKLSPNASPIELIFKNTDKYAFWNDQNNIKFLEKVFSCQKLHLIWKDEYDELYFFSSPKFWFNPVLRQAYVDRGFKIPKNTIKFMVNEENASCDDIEFLLKHGANIGEGYLLRDACREGNFEIAKLLIEKGLEINTNVINQAIDSIDRRIVTSSNWSDFIKFLVNKIPVENRRYTLHGLEHAFDSELFFSRDYFSQEEEIAILHIVDFLIENGMTKNSVDYTGNTLIQNVDERISRNYFLSAFGRKLYDKFR